jgi:hypothetical protein
MNTPSDLRHSLQMKLAGEGWGGGGVDACIEPFRLYALQHGQRSCRPV